MKIIPPDQLKNYSLCADIIDTHISEWNNGELFVRFQKKRRPFSGLFFMLSDLEAAYTESDENGNIVRQVHAKKGDILYIPKYIRYDIVFSIKSSTKQSDTCTINFDLYDQQGTEVQPAEHITLLNNKVNSYMTEDLLNIHRITRNPLACDKLHINALFFSILYYATKNRGESKNADAIKIAVNAIENDYHKNEKIEKYAQMCGMSPTYFYQEFRVYTGMSPTKYRNHIRINVAKSDIYNTDMTMKEIARKVGFDDEFYFSRLFKAITGMSPKKFKQE